MQPAFDNTLKNVRIPFGSRIISPIPREHNLVRGSSFGDRFVEGIYLHATLTRHHINIFDVHRKQEIVVKDFTSYPSEFPFKDPSCLTCPGYSATEIEEMHQEDLAAEARRSSLAPCVRVPVVLQQLARVPPSARWNTPLHGRPPTSGASSRAARARLACRRAWGLLYERQPVLVRWSIYG
jgi:hypothetical protein